MMAESESDAQHKCASAPHYGTRKTLDRCLRPRAHSCSHLASDGELVSIADIGRPSGRVLSNV